MVNASGSNWQLGLLDFTGCEMVLVLKLITLAVARQDSWQSKKRGKVSAHSRMGAENGGSHSAGERG